MATKKQSGTIGIIIAIITVVGVGTYSFDFSQNNSTNINDSSTNIDGNTIILEDGNGITCADLVKACEEEINDAKLKAMCNVLDVIC